MPEAFVRFAAARTGLEPEFVEEIVAAVEAAEPEFRDRMRPLCPQDR